MSEAKPTCADCCYFHEHDSEGPSHGQCRRRAPSPLGGRWASVKKTDWCGEHKPLGVAVNAGELQPLPYPDDEVS